VVVELPQHDSPDRKRQPKDGEEGPARGRGAGGSSGRLCRASLGRFRASLANSGPPPDGP
jgi:hypothetical protein